MNSVILNITNSTHYKFSKLSVEKAILSVLKSKKIQGTFELDLKLVTKKEIQTLNNTYRHKDIPTDVLSFPIFDRVEGENLLPTLLGDIIICPAVMNKNALEFNQANEKEFIKLIKHSVLHLVGIHHKGD